MSSNLSFRSIINLKNIFWKIVQKFIKIAIIYIINDFNIKINAKNRKKIKLRLIESWVNSRVRLCALHLLWMTLTLQNNFTYQQPIKCLLLVRINKTLVSHELRVISLNIDFYYSNKNSFNNLFNRRINDLSRYIKSYIQCFYCLR